MELITPWRRISMALLLGLALVTAACEKPDASFQTAPGVKALIGTTTGNVAFNPPELAPPPRDPPPKWAMELALASFSELENGKPSLEVILQMKAREGAGMELWLRADDDGRTIARWSGGSSGVYEGAVCFQLVMQDNGEAIPLPPGKYHLTVAFRDPATGIVVARDARVTSSTPVLKGAPPAPGSTLFQQTLACRRGS